MSSAPTQQVPPEKVWWVIWFVLLSNPFIATTFLKKAKISAESPLPWQIALLPFAVAMVIRWGVLPRVTRAELGFVLFIVGLAMCEMPTYLGIFIFPHGSQELFAATVVGIAMYVPTFAKRFFIQK